MPASKVCYAVDSVETMLDVCDEIAGIIIANRSSEFHIGVIAFGLQRSELMLKLAKPTVETARILRENADGVFSKIGGPAPLHISGDVFVSICAKEIPTLLPNVDVVITRRRDGVVNTTNPSIPLRGVSNDNVPVRHVSPRSTFDGAFTVGDPANPLIKVDISMYPATRRPTSVDVVKHAPNNNAGASSRVVRSSELKTATGHYVDGSNVQKGYIFLNQLICVPEEVQQLMDGEFEGAEEWNQAFELLATVPEVPPWIPYDRTDYVVGNTPRAVEFLRAFGSALRDSKMHALIRLCHAPRTKQQGDHRVRKKKGKLELLLLQPAPDGHIYASPLPFNDDFKSYYQFQELPEEPRDAEKTLDIEMDEVVDNMTVDSPPEYIRNITIERIARYIKTKIATGESVVPPIPSLPQPVDSKRLQELTKSIAKGYGIKEVPTATDGRASEGQDGAGIEFDFI